MHDQNVASLDEDTKPYDVTADAPVRKINPVQPLKVEQKSAQRPAAPAVQAQKIRPRAAVASRQNLTMTLRQWHQRAGLFAFIFMGWLGFSGFLLNQSASWGLDAIRVKSQALMALYGLHAEAPETGYLSGEHWLATTTENTVVDGHVVAQHIPSPIGLARTGKGDETLLYVATSDQVTVLSPDGERVDELSDYMLPVGFIRDIGTLTRGDSNWVALKGESTYISADGLSWSKLDTDAAVQWSVAQTLDQDMQKQVEPFARPTMPLEQVLIDLHSGRLFNPLGPYIINVVGFASMWLSISGVWMMWRTSRRRRAR